MMDSFEILLIFFPDPYFFPHFFALLQTERFSRKGRTELKKKQKIIAFENNAETLFNHNTLRLLIYNEIVVAVGWVPT